MNFLPRIRMIHGALLLFSACMLLAAPVSRAQGKQAPIHIEADRMVSHEQDNSVIFSGNVDAKQGDLLIRTDEMTVYYTKSGKSQSEAKSEVKKMICRGNVQISQGAWLGTGNRMDYFAQDRKVILSGEAKGWQGENMVEGKTITYFLDEGRSIVEAHDGTVAKDGAGSTGQGRVKAVIQPKSSGR